MEGEEAIQGGKGENSSVESSEAEGTGAHNTIEEGSQAIGSMEVNMMFTIPAEFCAPRHDVVELVVGVERAVFEKPKKAEEHMKSLFIRGHLDGAPVGHMLVDGGASVNILPLSVFKKLGHGEGDLKRTNLSLSGFLGEPTEAKGIVCKELMVGSKTMPMAFFVIDVKGRYNVLLRRDWIHANECVPSTLHQCIIQWIGNRVEVVKEEDVVCVALAESQVHVKGEHMKCLTYRDLTEYDYASIGKEGFVPISVKTTTSATRLANDIV
jgi:hypothetical protein